MFQIFQQRNSEIFSTRLGIGTTVIQDTTLPVFIIPDLVVFLRRLGVARFLLTTALLGPVVASISPVLRSISRSDCENIH